MPFVLMKIFEEDPHRFDSWMNLLTLGRLKKIQHEIAGGSISPGSQVLELGCGTGTLAVLMAEHGAHVIAIDASEGMVAQALERLKTGPMVGTAQVKKLHALQIEDTFQEQEFDYVVSSLALSEMSDDEIDCVLPQCQKLLKPGGRLIIVDEIEPENIVRRWFFRAIRYPARLVTSLYLEGVQIKRTNILMKIYYFAIEIPLILLTFLVVPPATHPIKNLESRIRRAGFTIANRESWLGGSLALVQAETHR